MIALALDFDGVLSDSARVEAGLYHNLLLRTNGEVAAWGPHYYHKKKLLFRSE